VTSARNHVSLLELVPRWSVKVLAEKDKRQLIFSTVAHAARVTYNSMADRIEDMFIEHGYIRPSPSTIHLRNLPTYTFVPVQEHFLHNIVKSLAEKRALAESKRVAIKEAIDDICETRKSQSVRLRAEVVATLPLPDCTCGHGLKVGRHKRGCARACPKKARCETPTQSLNEATDAAGLVDESPSRQRSPPTSACIIPTSEQCSPEPHKPLVAERVALSSHVPKGGLQRTLMSMWNPPRKVGEIGKQEAPAPLLSKAPPSQTIQIVEVIDFPDGPMEFEFSAVDPQDQHTPLFGCYMPRALIGTREINCWISDLRTFTPDFTFYDPIGFTVLQGTLQGEGRYASHRPRLLSHPLCVSVYYDFHFIALCFHPKSGALWIFDSAQSHYPQKRETARMDLMRWLQMGGNVVKHQNLVQYTGESGLNDCAIYSLNCIVNFALGQPGIMSREQMQLRFFDPQYHFAYVSPGANIVRVLFNDHCKHCGATLRIVEGRNGNEYRGCIGVQCVQQHGSYRGAM
jgi:hypothetical protein